jgi:hypothetical protein
MRVRLPKKLTAAQHKAMMDEVQNQIGENIERLTSNLVAIVLWELHEQEGWGKTKLLRFHKKFVGTLKELQDYYVMHTAEETDFICKRELQKVGINVDELDDILHIKVAYK